MKTKNRKRLAILTSHPIQYQAPLFRYLAKKEDIDIKVFFCWNFGVTEKRDGQFGVSFQWDIPLLEGYEHEFLRNRSKRPGVSHYKGLYNPDSVDQIRNFLPDAVLVHGYAHWTPCHVINKLYNKVPLLFRGESNLLMPRPLHVRFVKSILLKYLFGKISAFLSIGSYNTEYYFHYGIGDDRIFLSPYTVDNEFFQSHTEQAIADATEIRTQLGIGDRMVILFSGKFIPKKRPLELIEAFHSSGVYSECILVFAGEGELKLLMEQRIRELGIKNSVRFLGFRNQSQMPATYALGDVFVIPSSIEPWGLAVNEAMNLGLPVIASDMVSSTKDLVTHGENGWIYPSGDIERLSNCLMTAASIGRKGSKEMGIKSLERISRWGVPETVEGIISAMASVCR